jgi:hypothetical protein
VSPERGLRRSWGSFPTAFQIGVEILRPKLPAPANANRLELTRAEQAINGRALDAEHAGRLVHAQHRCYPKRSVAFRGEMTHGDDSVGRHVKTYGKGAQQVVEARARRRAALATTMPILGAHCPKALERIFDYSIKRLPVGGLRAAAEELLFHEQREKRERESPLDFAAAFELANAQVWAIDALIQSGITERQAKETELRLTDGVPLAICIGRTLLPRWQQEGKHRLRINDTPPRLGKLSGGTVTLPVYGCRTIFPDTTQTMKKMWRHWCDDCKESNSHPQRTAKRAQIRSAMNRSTS